MSMDVEALVGELNQTDEHDRIEAKTGTEAGKAVMKTVVAFANEPRLDGGYILFGLAKTTAPGQSRYSVVGVADPDKISTDFASQCASMLNRKIRPRITTEIVDGHPVVAAYIQEAQPAQKPVFLKKQGLDHGVYRRIGSSDQKCTEEDLEEIYQARSGETFDASIVTSADLDDIDSDAVEDYRRTRARVNPEAEELNYSDMDLLRALRCVEKQKGALCPTVAGILLFGTSMAIRRLFPGLKIDYTRVPGREWMDDPDRRYINSIGIRAPLLQAIRRAQSAVVDDLPRGFSLPKGSLQRVDTPLIPLKVLREAIVNAVMHRNYRSQGEAIHIIRYANRIEIRNPGDSLVDLDELGAPISKTRNPIIAGVLQDTRFAERKGTGVTVMRRNMQSAGLAPPEFESNRKTNHFITTLYLHHFLDAEDLDWLGRFQHLNLSEAQVRGLIHARETGEINNETYRELNGMDTLEASQELRRLRDAGLLTMEAAGNQTYYEPTDRLLAQSGDVQVELPFTDETSKPSDATIQAEEETTKLAEETTQAEEDALDVEARNDKVKDKPQKLTDETQKLEEQVQKLDAVLPDPPLPDALKQDVLKVRGQRTPRKELERVIRALCAWRPLSSSEVAALLDKNASHISSNYLAPMTEEAQLERTHPDAPRSPNQKYRAVSDA